MAEYIEKQAATMIPVLPKEHREYQTMNLDDAYENGWYDALECIENLPPADVWPVVRCKNCKYSRESDTHNVAGMLICFVDEQVYPPSRNDVFVGREYFCGYGEARND